jgi:hypothetical protein
MVSFLRSERDLEVREPKRPHKPIGTQDSIEVVKLEFLDLNLIRLMISFCDSHTDRFGGSFKLDP